MTDTRRLVSPPAAGVAYVPFLPLDGFSSLQSAILSDVASRLYATSMQLALVWLFRRAPDIAIGRSRTR